MMQPKNPAPAYARAGFFFQKKIEKEKKKKRMVSTK